MSERVDVAVVGAGLSGLTCARRLEQAGRTVCVIEARDRVGGRALSVDIGGAMVDMGAQWITPGQTRVTALAEELGVALVRDERAGEVVIGQDPSQRGSWLSRLPLLSTFELPRRIRELEDMSRTLAANPGVIPAQAVAWDALSLADWLSRKGRADRTRSAIRLLAELNFAAPPHDISLLFFLWSLATTGTLSGRELGGSDERRVDGGAQRLCIAAASGLGGTVHLDMPVTAIAGTTGDYALTTERGSFHARHIVLAVPPVLSRSLLGSMDEAVTAPGPAMAGVIKCALVYERPFWRRRRPVGEAYNLDGYMRAAVDATREDGPPMLLAFIVGDGARALSQAPVAERRRIVTEELAQLIGDEALSPTDYTDKDWLADPWSQGCELMLRPGEAAAYLANARTPRGGIHIAGTESATRWARFLEGAVRAGERAADEIINPRAPRPTSPTSSPSA